MRRDEGIPPYDVWINTDHNPMTSPVLRATSPIRGGKGLVRTFPLSGKQGVGTMASDSNINPL